MDQEPPSPAPIFARPRFRLTNPGRVLSADDFEFLGITAEDLRFLARSIDEDWIESPPEIRAVSVILRRLLVDNGLFRAAKLARWPHPFSVTTDLLNYERPHPQVIVWAGGVRWGRDRMPDFASIWGGPTVQDPTQEWSFEKRKDIALSKYLKSLSFGMIGHPIKRQDVITYVANKKAAHLSDTRTIPAHEVLDHLWHGLFITREDGEGNAETMNYVYLELLGIITAIAESPSIQGFAKWLLDWLRGYRFEYGPEAAKEIALRLPIDPIPDS